MSVENADGQKLGKIRDVILDDRTGDPGYVVILSGGLLRRHFKVAPAQAVSLATAKRRVAFLDVTRKRWAEAPEFRKEEMRLSESVGRWRQITAFYSRTSRGDRNMSITGQPALARTGRDGEEKGRVAPGGFELASEVAGMNVVNERGLKVGEVKDLLLDFSAQKATLAVIKTGQLLKHGSTYAVPLGTLRSSPRDKLILSAKPESLDAAPFFNETAWQSMRSSGPVSLLLYGPRVPDAVGN